MRNRIEVEGYLADKPGRRLLGSGTPIANVRMGETYGFRDRGGNIQKQTNWHSLSFYGELADLAMSFEKGDHLFIEGSIEQREFTPKDGSPRTVHEIVVRSCHLITPPRPRANGTAPSAEEKGVVDDWPVR